MASKSSDDNFFSSLKTKNNMPKQQQTKLFNFVNKPSVANNGEGKNNNNTKRNFANSWSNEADTYRQYSSSYQNTAMHNANPAVYDPSRDAAVKRRKQQQQQIQRLKHMQQAQQDMGYGDRRLSWPQHSGAREGPTPHQVHSQGASNLSGALGPISTKAFIPPRMQYLKDEKPHSSTGVKMEPFDGTGNGSTSASVGTSLAGSVGSVSSSVYTSSASHSAPPTAMKGFKSSASEVITLSLSQKKVLDAIMQKKSVFFTGAAGTGKSFVLKILRELMEKTGRAHRIAFTAPTGVAACNISGLTIHAWAGVGVAKEPTEQLVAKVRRNRSSSTKWTSTDILVIDEVSMLAGDLFDKLDAIGRGVRGSSEPFGGLQLVLCGDFFQLPPVGLGKGGTTFCFLSDAWSKLFGEQPESMIVLDKVFRQQGDTVFLDILNEMRYGRVNAQAVQLLNGKVEAAARLQLIEEERQLQQKRAGMGGRDPGQQVKPTKLFSTNKDVDAYNQSELTKLAVRNEDIEKNGIQYYTFIARDAGTEPFLSALRSGTKAPQQLELKVGAQVMLLKNRSTQRGLVNGSRGTVIGFEASDGRSPNYPYMPVVKFLVSVGGAQQKEEIVAVSEESWDIQVGGVERASRTQIPLMLAWAISIHKSQGMTIPLLEVSFNGMFEYGQGYVALSRATCLSGLTLRSFNPNTIRAHSQVKEFYAYINGIQSHPLAPRGSNGGSVIVNTTLVELIAQFRAILDAPKGRDVGGDQEDEDGWIDTEPRKAQLSATAAGAVAAVVAVLPDTNLVGSFRPLAAAAADTCASSGGRTRSGSGRVAPDSDSFCSSSSSKQPSDEAASRMPSASISSTAGFETVDTDPFYDCDIPLDSELFARGGREFKPPIDYQSSSSRSAIGGGVSSAGLTVDSAAADTGAAVLPAWDPFAYLGSATSLNEAASASTNPCSSNRGGGSSLSATTSASSSSSSSAAAAATIVAAAVPQSVVVAAAAAVGGHSAAASSAAWTARESAHLSGTGYAVPQHDVHVKGCGEAKTTPNEIRSLVDARTDTSGSDKSSGSTNHRDTDSASSYSGDRGGRGGDGDDDTSRELWGQSQYSQPQQQQQQQQPQPQQPQQQQQQKQQRQRQQQNAMSADLKRRIELNRRAAMEKLAKRKREQEEERLLVLKNLGM